VREVLGLRVPPVVSGRRQDESHRHDDDGPIVWRGTGGRADGVDQCAGNAVSMHPQCHVRLCARCWALQLNQRPLGQRELVARVVSDSPPEHNHPTTFSSWCLFVYLLTRSLALLLPPLRGAHSPHAERDSPRAKRSGV
jgi:hypothetical protein